MTEKHIHSLLCAFLQKKNREKQKNRVMAELLQKKQEQGSAAYRAAVHEFAQLKNTLEDREKASWVTQRKFGAQAAGGEAVKAATDLANKAASAASAATNWLGYSPVLGRRSGDRNEIFAAFYIQDEMHLIKGSKLVLNASVRFNYDEVYSNFQNGLRWGEQYSPRISSGLHC